MATLTTVDGIQITFVAKTVSAMADHDANTGFAVTCVYGVTKGVSANQRVRAGVYETCADHKRFRAINPSQWFPDLDQWISGFLNPFAPPERVCGGCQYSCFHR